MAVRIRRVDYFYLNVKDPARRSLQAPRAVRGARHQPARLYRRSDRSARIQLTIFPEDPPHLVTEARQTGLALDGPHPALLVQGDDELGALADVHRRLYEANVNVYAANGVAVAHVASAISSTSGPTTSSGRHERSTSDLSGPTRDQALMFSRTAGA